MGILLMIAGFVMVFAGFGYMVERRDEDLYDGWDETVAAIIAIVGFVTLGCGICLALP